MSVIKRREFLGGLALSLLFHRFSNESATAQESQSVNIQWHVPAKQVIPVRESLNFEGEVIPGKTEDDKGLPLLYILVGAVALGVLAKTLLDIYKDAKYGGIIVRRTKKGDLLIQNDPRLESGTIIVDQGKEIKVIFKEKDQPQAKDLIDALAPLVKK